MTAAWPNEPARRSLIETLRLPDAASWEAGWVAMGAAVAQVRPSHGACFQRFLVRFGPDVAVAPLRWLGSQRPGARLYWAERDGPLVLAGVGVADRIAANHHDAARVLDALSGRLATHRGGARYLGHLMFDGARSAGQDAVRMTLPQVEVGRDADGLWLAVHRDTRRPPLDLKAVASPAFTEVWGALPGVVASSCEPSRDRWVETVDNALDAIASEHVRKVVLARASTYMMKRPVEPTALLARVAARDPETFHFLLEHGPGDAFVGASPERLYRRDGRQLVCDSLAGTRARGRTNTEDQALADALLASRKDLGEQAVVTRAIEASLATLAGQDVERSAPQVRRFAHVQHLWSRLSATLAPTVGDGAVLTTLHPTPAVCGSPTTEARTMLSGLERFSREHYAAPVGWIGADGAEFAVGLRSTRVTGRRLTLFAGAGIVAGSEPLAEWDELDAKDRGTLAALLGEGVEDPAERAR